MNTIKPRKQRDEKYHQMVEELTKAVKDQMLSEDEAYELFKKQAKEAE